MLQCVFWNPKTKHRKRKYQITALVEAGLNSTPLPKPSADQPCGISPSACECLDPVPEIRPSSRAVLLCSRFCTVPSGLPSATCPRWLGIGRFPPPGTGGTVGSAVPSWREQSAVASLVGRDKTTNTGRRPWGVFKEVSCWPCTY